MVLVFKSAELTSMVHGQVRYMARSGTWPGQYMAGSGMARSIGKTVENQSGL